MSKTSEPAPTPDFDYASLRDTVLDYANRVGLRNAAAIARAIGVNDSLPSRWFRGVTRPTAANLERLADVTGAPYADLMFDAGLDPNRRLTGEVRPVRDAAIPPVVAEIASMFSARSPLSDESRGELEKFLDRGIETWRKEMRSRRKPA